MENKDEMALNKPDIQYMYQVSTLQALATGYTRSVVNVGELLKHADTGLGTFEDVDGEMILLDGICYRATEDGTVLTAPEDKGVPFCAGTRLLDKRTFIIEETDSIDELKKLLNVRIEEDFGLNSMHVVRIDGDFKKICARSESGYKSQHVSLKDVLGKTQRDFFFDDITGSLVCLYFPDYMDGINAPGWHLHFVSSDSRFGGHVFDLKLIRAKARMDKISRIDIRLPDSPAFDTYSLKEVSQEEIKEVEQKSK